MGVKFGVAITTSEPPEKFIESARLAERMGFDYVWVPDRKLGRDVFASLALCAINTTRVNLGSAVTNPYTRHPALLATAIATIDEISKGRAVLGMGPGGLVLSPLCIERKNPLATCKEAIQTIRSLLRGESVDYHGKTIKLKRAMLDFKPRRDIPIYLAATGPKMLQLAGEVADGVIINVGVSQGCLDFALEKIRLGSEKGNRDFRTLDLVCWVHSCSIFDDGEVAKEAVKPAVAEEVAWFVETPVLFKLTGISIDDARRIRKRYYENGAAAAKLVTSDMVEKFAIAGTSEDCVRKIKALTDIGINQVLLWQQKAVGQDIKHVMRIVAKEIIPKFR